MYVFSRKMAVRPSMPAMEDVILPTPEKSGLMRLAFDDDGGH